MSSTDKRVPSNVDSVPDVSVLLDEIREVLKGITPGEWKLWNGWGPARDGLMRVERIGPNDPDAWQSLHTSPDSCDITGTRADFELIAKAPHLLRAVLRVLEEKDKDKGLLGCTARESGDGSAPVAAKEE